MASVKCPKCGAPNELDPGKKILHCAYCNSESYIDRSGAAFVYAVMPGSIYYGRTFTPDATMVFFLTAALSNETSCGPSTRSRIAGTSTAAHDHQLNASNPPYKSILCRLRSPMVPASCTKNAQSFTAHFLAKTG